MHPLKPDRFHGGIGSGARRSKVVTDTGDFILDNRRNDITRWKDVPYTFLKRQSQANPKAWVALVKEKTIATGEVSASSQD